MLNNNMRRNQDRFFSPKVSGILSLIGGTMLLVLDLQDGSLLRAALVGVILASGVSMILKSQ